MPQVVPTARINSLRKLLVAPLQVDSATALTYGPAIPLGAESELTFGLNIVTEDLQGARGTLESDAYVNNATWQLTHGEIDLRLFALAFGGQYVDVPESTSGAGDSKVLYGLQQGLTSGYIGIIGQPVTVAGGPADFYIALLKCRVESFDGGRLGGGWAQIQLGGRAFYTIKDKLLFMAATLEKRTDGTFDVVTQDIEEFMAGLN